MRPGHRAQQPLVATQGRSVASQERVEIPLRYVPHGRGVVEHLVGGTQRAKLFDLVATRTGLCVPRRDRQRAAPRRVARCWAARAKRIKDHLAMMDSYLPCAL